MTFGDGLRESFEMAYREAAGYATDTYRSSIPPFIEHCADNYPDSTAVTRKMVDGWLAEHPYSANSRAVFISLLREYTKCLRFLGRDDFIPDDEYPTKRIAFHPYLFTDEELHRLFTAFDSCTGATCGGNGIFRKLSCLCTHAFYSAVGCAPRNRRLFCAGMWICQPVTFISGSQNGIKTVTS